MVHAHTGHPAARDPYFLYAASNLGSMLALLGYPTLIEPRLHLKSAGWLSQTQLWTAGYLTLAVLTVACALILWGSVFFVLATPPRPPRRVGAAAPVLRTI